MKKLLLLGAMCLSLSACDFGEVDQGRCVAYDASANTFTMVQDKNHDQLNPDYTGGVMTYTMPADPAEAGPEPKAGGRVKFDVEKKQVILFVNGELKTVDIEFTDIQNDIAAHNPKLFEDSAMKTPRKFPVIDKDNGTITEYSKRLRKLLTFKVPAEYINLPPETWEAGDEVRIYYKPNAKHQALRFMNITQTNIFKK
jgi:hypothetical protein